MNAKLPFLSPRSSPQLLHSTQDSDLEPFFFRSFPSFFSLNPPSLRLPFSMRRIIPSKSGLSASMQKNLILRFGLPAAAAAFAGAMALGYVSHSEEIIRYTLGSRTASVTTVKLAIAVLIFAFALSKLLPSLRNKKYLILGGILSGFFGGGHSASGSDSFGFHSKGQHLDGSFR